MPFDISIISPLSTLFILSPVIAERISSIFDIRPLIAQFIPLPIQSYHLSFSPPFLLCYFSLFTTPCLSGYFPPIKLLSCFTPISLLSPLLPLQNSLGRDSLYSFYFFFLFLLLFFASSLYPPPPFFTSLSARYNSFAISFLFVFFSYSRYYIIYIFFLSVYLDSLLIPSHLLFRLIAPPLLFSGF